MYNVAKTYTVQERVRHPDTKLRLTNVYGNYLKKTLYS